MIIAESVIAANYAAISASHSIGIIYIEVYFLLILYQLCLRIVIIVYTTTFVVSVLVLILWRSCETARYIVWSFVLSTIDGRHKNCIVIVPIGAISHLFSSERVLNFVAVVVVVIN